LCFAKNKDNKPITIRLNPNIINFIKFSSPVFGRDSGVGIGLVVGVVVGVISGSGSGVDVIAGVIVGVIVGSGVGVTKHACAVTLKLKIIINININNFISTPPP
jgi:hypothetical protein